MKTNEFLNKAKWTTPIISTLHTSETQGAQPGTGEDGTDEAGSL